MNNILSFPVSVKRKNDTKYYEIFVVFYNNLQYNALFCIIQQKKISMNCCCTSNLKTQWRSIHECVIFLFSWKLLQNFQEKTFWRRENKVGIYCIIYFSVFFSYYQKNMLFFFWSKFYVLLLCIYTLVKKIRFWITLYSICTAENCKKITY
jgi:hypothetical protein